MMGYRGALKITFKRHDAAQPALFPLTYFFYSSSQRSKTPFFTPTVPYKPSQRTGTVPRDWGAYPSGFVAYPSRVGSQGGATWEWGGCDPGADLSGFVAYPSRVRIGGGATSARGARLSRGFGGRGGPPNQRTLAQGQGGEGAKRPLRGGGGAPPQRARLRARIGWGRIMGLDPSDRGTDPSRVRIGGGATTDSGGRYHGTDPSDYGKDPSRVFHQAFRIENMIFTRETQRSQKKPNRQTIFMEEEGIQP